MLYLVIFLLLFITMLVLALIINVNVFVEYNRVGDDDEFAISAFALGSIIKYKLEFPLFDFSKGGLKVSRITEKGKKEKDFDKDKGKFSITDIYQKFIKLKEFFGAHINIINEIKEYLLKKLVLKEFTLNVSFGAGDPFYTGISAGGLWTLAGTIASFLSNNFRTFKNCVNIKPNFYEKELIVDLCCIFRAKIVHIIIVGLKLLVHYLKMKYKLKTMIGGGVSG